MFVSARARVSAFTHPYASSKLRSGSARTTRATQRPQTSTSLKISSFELSLALASSIAVTVGPALAETVESVPLTKQPAFIGFACVAVCWGIPQTLGTMVLAKKEARARELLAEAGIDASDIEQGSWGRIQTLCQDNGVDWRQK